MLILYIIKLLIFELNIILFLIIIILSFLIFLGNNFSNINKQIKYFGE